MRAKVVLRRVTDADSLQELLALIHDAYAELARTNLHYLAATQDEEVTRRRMSGGECWVAQADGRLVGTILLHPPQPTGGGWYGHCGAAKFSQFAVDPSWQRCGIGTILLDAAERRATEWGVHELACDTAVSAKHLIRMYKRRGYHYAGYASWPNTSYYSVILSKPLGMEKQRMSLVSHCLERCGFYYGMMATICRRRIDGRDRLWVRAARRVMSFVWGRGVR